MMHEIHLYGHLREEFGPKFRFEIATAGEAVRALNCAFPGRFIEQLRKGSYRVVRGDPENGMDLSLDHLNSLRLGSADLHLIPVAAGSKGSSAKGTLEIVVGAAIIGAAIFFSDGTLAAPLAGMNSAVSIGGVSLGVTYGNIAMVGLAVALLGVANLVAKAPVNNDNTQSFTFTGPINVDQQGNAVPLVFGEVMAGSQSLSVGYLTEDIGSYSPVNSGTPLTAEQQAVASALQNNKGLMGL